MTNPQTNKALADELGELRKFLDGSGALSGAYFGEKRGSGAFWWRRYLVIIDKSEAALRTDREAILREALELLRQAMNALGTVDNNDPMEPIADNGMVVWDGMQAESARLWPKYRALLAALNPEQAS